MGDDPRPPSHARDVRPASSTRGEAGPAASDAPQPWLDVPDEQAPRRRLWVLVAAVLPWIVLAALVVRAPVDSAATPADPVATGSPTPSETLATPTASTAPSSAATSAPTIPAGAMELPGSRNSLGLADVAAAAIPVVRAWLGAAEPLSIEGLEPRPYGWVEHAAVEAVDYPGLGAAVASVLAIVLPTDGEQWLESEVVRVGVPLRLRDGQVVPAGQPWLLPPPRLAAEPFEGVPIDDGQLLSDASLMLIEFYPGFRRLHQLLATEAWPLVADVTIADPLDGVERRQHIWLRATPRGVTVAGWFSRSPAGVAFPRDGSASPDKSPTAAPTSPPGSEEDS